MGRVTVASQPQSQPKPQQQPVAVPAAKSVAFERPAGAAQAVQRNVGFEAPTSTLASKQAQPTANPQQRPGTAPPRGAPPTARVAEPAVSDLLRGDPQDTADDAITTRERMRHQRRSEVSALYDASVAVREARDPARKVVCNEFHQQLDVAPSLPGQPLVKNLVGGAYYEAREAVPELNQLSRGLGRRVPSSNPLPVPAAARPQTAAEQRRAAEAALEKERALIAAMQAAARSGAVGGVRPFPQDDLHDYWGRPVSRHATQRPSSNRSTISLVDPAPPQPIGLQNVPPMPGFDMNRPDNTEGGDVWHKPMVTAIKVPVPAPELKTRAVMTDPQPELVPASNAPAVLSKALPVPTAAATERVAAMKLLEPSSVPAVHATVHAAPASRPGSAAAAARLQTTATLVPHSNNVNPACAGQQRFRSRPLDMMTRLF